ncbi:MAG TPA: hypothetical protein VLD65_12525 [Anaerolineales bacterium]|nr:hypothetical protein [Anaerolineales bacterium]
MNTKTRIGLWVLVVLLIGFGTFLYSRRASATNDLTSLGPNDAMAYRYTAMAQYYEKQSSILASSNVVSKAGSSTSSGSARSFSGYPLPGVDLTTLSPVDATVYRYQAMAYFYSIHPDAAR